MVVAVIVTLGVVVFIQLSHVDRAAQDVTRGEAVVQKLMQIQRSVDQQESNTRAYVSVQNPHYLERLPVHDGRFGDHVAELREMMVRVPGADEQIDALETAVADYRREIGEAETRLAGNPATRAEAMALVESGAAATWMDPIDAAFAELTQMQEARLEHYNASQDRAVLVARTALFAGVA